MISFVFCHLERLLIPKFPYTDFTSQHDKKLVAKLCKAPLETQALPILALFHIPGFPAQSREYSCHWLALGSQGPLGL